MAKNHGLLFCGFNRVKLVWNARGLMIGNIHDGSNSKMGTVVAVDKESPRDSATL